MFFIEDLITIGAEAEVTPGTAETLLAANYNIRSSKPQYDHTIAELKRKYATGNFSPDLSLMGKQEGSFSFSVYLAEGPTIITSEAVVTLLNACGILDTVNGATGVWYTPYTPYNSKTCTIEIPERGSGVSPSQLVNRFVGCIGTAKLVLDEPGQPAHWDFEFKGKLVAIVDRAFGAYIAPAFGTTKPTKVLSATITRGAVSLCLESFTLDFKNNVQQIGCADQATGILHYFIAGREITLTINPLVNTLAADPVYTEWLAETTQIMTITFGNFSIVIPKSQYIAVKPSAKNGARIYEKTLLCVKNSDAGDDEVKLIQGV